MKYLKVRNWERWQTYRSDRACPPWIKLHRVLLRHHEWGTLTDAAKGQLVSIWMLAADKSGLIPEDPGAIQKLCGLDTMPELARFIELEFIQGGAKTASEWKRIDAEATPRDSQCGTEKDRQKEEQKERGGKVDREFHEDVPKGIAAGNLSSKGLES